MNDLHDRFAALELLEAPDQWDAIRELANTPLPLAPAPERRVSPWRGPALAFAAAAMVLVVGAILMLLREDPESEVVQPTIEAIETIEPDSWNSILAETKAKPAPAPAVCDTVAIPEAGDAPHWPRPYESAGHLSGVFDQRAGVMLYVDWERTWSFDVCTNTWTRRQDLEWAFSRNLVHDIDSDRILSFAYDGYWLFDRGAGTWTQSAYPSFGDEELHGFFVGIAVYDPISGLIIVPVDGPSPTSTLWAYDVDTDTWTEVGEIPRRREFEHGGVLLGYSSRLDRLVATGGGSDTQLIDPRSGISSVFATTSPENPWSLRRGGYLIAHTAGSILVDDLGADSRICEFDAMTLAWDACYPLPDEATHPGGLPASLTPLKPDAAVEDTINNRLLVPMFSGPDHTDGIWAYDRNTAEWTFIPFALGPGT